LYRTGPVAALILGLALALASCGGGGSSSGGTTAPAANSDTGQIASGGTVRPSGGAEATATGTPSDGDEATGAGLPGATTAPDPGSSACSARLGEFVARMDDLRQSLLAGLSYAEYVVRVKAIRDAYEAVPVDRLGATCLAGAAADAEDAFNQYLRAANTWGECAGTEGCAASEIEGKLQHRWRIASKHLDAAAHDQRD
jgi:hypothetical protein